MNSSPTNIRRRALACGALLVPLSLGFLGAAACSPDAGAAADSAGDPEAHSAPRAGERGEERLAGQADAQQEIPEQEGEAHSDERIMLTEAGSRNAGIRVAEVERLPEDAASDALEVPGRVEFAPDRVALITPRTPGRIERLTVVEGDQVREGQPVAYLLSPSFLTAQDDFVQAERRAEMLAGTEDEEGARALVSAAERRLTLLGAPPGLIEDLRSGETPRDFLPVVAPFDGSIVEAYTLTGAAVESGSPIFRIADLSGVDVVADVPEQALSVLEIGRTVSVRPAAYPERSLTGRIERLHHELDPGTRTIPAIVHVPNPDRTLRPGMFAYVRLRVPLRTDDTVERPGDGRPRPDGAEAKPTLAVPASALVSDGPDRFLFVEVEPLTFERRRVRVTPLDGDSTVVVRSGLAPGERVVVSGAFTLMSELAAGSFGDEH
jgi:multidrug efflux pump subunit AcrA (membrane-fusion protein)